MQADAETSVVFSVWSSYPDRVPALPGGGEARVYEGGMRPVPAGV